MKKLCLTAFLKKNFILWIYLLFCVFFGWVIFEEIKDRQVFTDLNFSEELEKFVPAGTETEIPFKVKTDSMFKINIPFRFSEDISADDFSENIDLKQKKSEYECFKSVGKRGGNNAVLVLLFLEPVNINSVKITCQKNVSYFLDGQFFQTEQYGLPQKAEILFWFAYIVFVLFLFAIFKCVNLFVKNFSLKYFLTVVLLGIGCICIFPAFNVPDEKVHFNSVNYFLDRFEGRCQKWQGWNEVDLRSCDNQIYPEKVRNEPVYPYSKDLGYNDDYLSYYSNALSKIFKPAKDTEFITTGAEVVHWQRMIYFIPHMIGVAICRALNTNQFVLYYFTCFLALLWNSSIISFAFAKTKCNSSLFYFLGLNLGLLQQMCHFTYDGTIYALAFAFVLFFFNFYKNRKISDLILSVICLVLLFPAKVQIYMPLALFYLLLFEKPLKLFFKNKKRIFIFIAAIVLASVVAALIYVSKNQNLYTSFDGIGFKHTKTAILVHPINTFIEFIYTISVMYKEYVGGLLGLLLGVRKWYVSVFCVLCYFVIFYYSITDKTNIEISKSEKIVSVVVTVFVSLSIFAGMFMTETYTSVTYVLGVQGRYFIPVLPLILMLFNPEKLRFKMNDNYNNLSALQLAIPLYVVVVYLNLVATLLNV